MGLHPLVPVVKNGKKIIVDGWQTLSGEELEKMVAANNGGNVGIRLDNYAVIDPDEPAAEIFVNDWEREGKLTPTVCWKTARGFTKRLYLRPNPWPFDTHTANIPNMKLQLRSGSGVQDVLPPSYVIDNIKKFRGRYEWIPGHDPDQINPAPLPDAILDYFQKHSDVKAVPLKSSTQSTGDSFDIETFLSDHGVEVVKVKPWRGGTIYGLRHCLFYPDLHVNNDAAIVRQADGKIIYQCFHDTCKADGWTWHDARKLISGSDRIAPSKGDSVHSIGKNTSSSLINTSTSITRGEEEGKGGGSKKDLLKALRENTLTPQQKSYLVELIENRREEVSIAEEVRQFVMTSNDPFLTSNVHNILGLTSRDLKKQANEVLRRMVDKGEITNCGRGCYRRVEEVGEVIDYMSVDPDDFVRIDLPFRLHQLVKLFPKNLIVLAGSTNAGKSAFQLDVCRLNMGKDGRKIRYISTEMDKHELRERLGYYAEDTGELYRDIGDWKKMIDFRLIHPRHILDMIHPNWINIVDYYSTSVNFYDIDKEFQEIHRKLKRGIAIIAIQKRRGAAEGVGGAFTEFLPRVVLNFDSNKMIIKKAKNLMPGIERGADGVSLKYKLVKGYKWILDQPIDPHELFWWWNYNSKEADTLAF